MKKILYYIVIIFILTGCVNKKQVYNENNLTKTIKKDNKIELYNLFLQNDSYILKKYEPDKNTYIGILTPDKSSDFIENFEKNNNIINSIYLYNLKIDEEFPLSWVLNCYSKGKVPFITLTPPTNKTNIYDIELLEEISKKFGKLKIPMFLNFYPLNEELAVAPKSYKDFFKMAKALFTVNAPNVAFIFTVNSEFAYNANMYYPGDECVDWVGINIYEDILEENKLKLIFNEIDIFYKNFQEKKPIAISNLAISHFSNNLFNYNVNKKIYELQRFFDEIPKKYPRIKMINYLDVDNFSQTNFTNQNEKEKQDYSITNNKELLKKYTELTQNDNFLKSVKLNNFGKISIQKFKTPFLIYKKDGSFFLEKYVINSLGYTNIDLLNKYYINGKTVYNFDEFLNLFSLKKIVDEENKNILIKSEQ